jgi:alpha,alpha-trehalose phosphorylase
LGRGLGPAARDSQWLAAADIVRLPYDDKLGVHAQSEDFTNHGEWSFEQTPPERYPLLLHYPYFQLYRKQVIKQADLVLAMHLCGDAFTFEDKARNFAYYEARTVRDSSLSAASQAIIAAELGHLDPAYDYWAKTAFTDDAATPVPTSTFERAPQRRLRRRHRAPSERRPRDSPDR